MKDNLSKNRNIAIQIMETISELVGHPSIFDGELWYSVEDEITEILDKAYPNGKEI